MKIYYGFGKKGVRDLFYIFEAILNEPKEILEEMKKLDKGSEKILIRIKEII